MAIDETREKLEQSNRITSIGCFGLVLVIVLIVLIGLIMVRSDINKKRANAVSILERMREQVDKAPDILNRMLAYDCGPDAESAVEEAVSLVNTLSAVPKVAELDNAWDAIDNARSFIGRGCREFVSDSAFIDLSTEMEGAKNRYSVEKGNFANAEEIYRRALDSFPGYLVAAGYDEF